MLRKSKCAPASIKVDIIDRGSVKLAVKVIGVSVEQTYNNYIKLFWLLNNCYPKIADLLSMSYTCNLLHTSSSLPLLTVPNPSTVFARRPFNYTAPTTWNSLPADILTCDSESGFKRLLKTHLFNNCFNVAWLTHSQRLCSSAYGALQICLWLWLWLEAKAKQLDTTSVITVIFHV